MARFLACVDLDRGTPADPKTRSLSQEQESQHQDLQQHMEAFCSIIKQCRAGLTDENGQCRAGLTDEEGKPG